MVLTTISGALRRYLDSKEELPERSMWAMLPIHVHHETDRGIPGHRVNLARAKIMTAIEDPFERLQAIHLEMIRVRSEDVLSANEITELQEVLPSTTMAIAARTIVAGVGPGEHFRENHNTIVTTVPGPEQTLYLCGAKLVGFTGMGIVLDNLALAHTVTDYDCKLAIAAVSDRSIMPDPGYYMECLQAAFDELLQVARKRAVKSTAAMAR